MSPTPDSTEPVERFWRIAARRALLCTGAEERPIVFGGNDRPGIMLAEAGLAYARRYGVAVGARIGVFTTNGRRLAGRTRTEARRRRDRGYFRRP